MYTDSTDEARTATNFSDRSSTDVMRYAGLIALLSLAWPIQYLLYVPTVWLLRVAGAIIGFATRSAGHIFLLFIPIFGWLWLGYLLVRSHPEKAKADRGYLRPWGKNLLAVTR